MKLSKSSDPFVLDNIKALSCLCGTFLFRWGNDGGKRQSYAMRLLNTLAFYHVEVVENEGDATQNVSLVHMLWCVLQDIRNFEDFAKMYEQEYPLPLCQIERIVLSLKHALHEAYWTHANLAPSSESVAFGMFVVEMATRLMRVLYNRCSRQPFCNVTSCERVKLFQRLVMADKDIHQNESCSVYRIRIHRGAILEDGLKKLNSIRTNLKKRINVVFVNSAGREEVGIDAGGLFKEFWLDLSTLAFDLQYGLFLTPTISCCIPTPIQLQVTSHAKRPLDDVPVVGRILGKALYEGIVVQPKFAHFFLSKLLHSFNQLNELPSLDPEIYKNLMFLKSYDGDVEDLGLTHTVVQEVFGEQKEIEIIPGGGNVPVTNRNKTRYIHLVANYYLNTQIREQCAAFRWGCPISLTHAGFRCSMNPSYNVAVAGIIEFYAFRAGSFLRFTTSCQRAPSLGFASLTPQFCVQKIPIRSDDELLPSSSTCFNTLKLPTYSSYKVLRAKLLTSISSGAGFEMT
ncbi:HECT domain [Phytophthora cactorum]|nr:HECT domain [Phytophthora cactorum]